MLDFLSRLPQIVAKRRKRRGRGTGSGKGAKSGRGTTRHQKARESIPLEFEGGQAKIIKKYPLLRGKGKNKPVKQRPKIVKLSTLDRFFKAGETVDYQALVKKRIVDAVKKETRVRVKILADGKLKKKLTVKLPVSKKAKEQIEKAGGKSINSNL